MRSQRNTATKSILVITTGGTIGSLPYPDPRKPPKYSFFPDLGSDPVRDLLTNAAFGITKTRVMSLEPRDSKGIDDAYREIIVDTVAQADEYRILITHGTDSMLQSAEYFYEQLRNNSGLKDKIILLTGAMIPLANGAESDGIANLKFSLEQLSQQEMDNGIYIVLSDYDAGNIWMPQIYLFEPNKYEKKYNTKDGRYNRLGKKH